MIQVANEMGDEWFIVSDDCGTISIWRNTEPIKYMPSYSMAWAYYNTVVKSERQSKELASARFD